MKWENLNNNLLTNKEQTVIKAAKLSDFTGNNLDNLPDIEVKSQTQGRSVSIKRSKDVIRMTSKLGTVAYFDEELVSSFKTSSSKLYLFPTKKVDLPPLLVIMNHDDVYIVFPYEVDKFVETPDLDNWI